MALSSTCIRIADERHASSSNVGPFAAGCASWMLNRIRWLGETGHRHTRGLALPYEGSCGLRISEGEREDFGSANRERCSGGGMRSGASAYIKYEANTTRVSMDAGLLEGRSGLGAELSA